MKKRKANALFSAMIVVAVVLFLSACKNSKGTQAVFSGEAGSRKAIVSSEAVTSESVSSASEPV